MAMKRTARMFTSGLLSWILRADDVTRGLLRAVNVRVSKQRSACLKIDTLSVCKQTGAIRPLFRVVFALTNIILRRDTQYANRQRLFANRGSPRPFANRQSTHTLTRPSPLATAHAYHHAYTVTAHAHTSHISITDVGDSSAPPPAAKMICLQTDILRCPCANRHVDKPLRARPERGVCLFANRHVDKQRVTGRPARTTGAPPLPQKHAAIIGMGMPCSIVMRAVSSASSLSSEDRA